MEEFAVRRAAARQRLDAIDPAKNGGGDPYRRDWFRAVYELASDDPACVPWADLAPHPLLAQWLEGRDLKGLHALDIGCGLGDNAQALSDAGAKTAGFDLSQKAIDWAKQRFPDSAVDYRVADLFAPPADWRAKFDLVHECYTLQALPSALLPQAAAALAHFLAPGGTLLVIARARPNPEAPAGPPWPLSRQDMEAMAAHGLSLVSIEQTQPAGEPSHWRALYRRVA
jgi:SAM-dependent methyltransferase